MGTVYSHLTTGVSTSLCHSAQKWPVSSHHRRGFHRTLRAYEWGGLLSNDVHTKVHQPFPLSKQAFPLHYTRTIGGATNLRYSLFIIQLTVPAISQNKGFHYTLQACKCGGVHTNEMNTTVHRPRPLPNQGFPLYYKRTIGGAA